MPRARIERDLHRWNFESCGTPTAGFYLRHDERIPVQELFRKVVHLLFGLGIAAMVLAAGQTVSIAILAGGLFVGVVIVDIILRGCRVPVFSALVEFGDRGDCPPGRGALYFAVSALVCVILFPVAISVPALVTLAVLDSVATMVGLRFGRARLSNGKSWEGTIAGIVVTVVTLVPFLSVPGAVIVSVVAGAIELVSPVDDNLVIPVAVCLLLALVPGLVLLSLN
jgi:dolichol kinase